MKALKIIDKVLTALLVGVLLLTVATVYLPQIFGYMPYAVISGSMEPKYGVGSLIYVKETPAQDIQVGDAVTFKMGQTVITHAVIEADRENNTFKTQGLANTTTTEGPFPYNQIIGKASDFSIPYAGYYLNFLSSTAGKILLLCAVGGMLLLMVVLFSEVKCMKKNNMGHGIKKLITKKRVLIAATVVTVSGIAVFATMAQLSGKSNDKENPFAPMTITDIQIEEPSGTDYVMDHNDTVKTKQVMINNPAGEAKKPVFIRVKVVPSVKNAQGAFTDGQVEIDQTATQISEDWLYDSGYYYYKRVVMPGQSTTELFKESTVKLICDLQEGQTVDLSVIADSVQAISNKPGEKESITTAFAKEAWRFDGFEAATVPQD